MGKIKPIEAGIRYGRLVTTGNFIERSKSPTGHTQAEFICDCGNVLFKRISNVIAGNSTCCGDSECTCRPRVFYKNPCRIEIKNGNSQSDKKIRKEYVAWSNIRKICNDKKNKDYKYYGGKGIEMCKEFDSFDLFIECVGFAPSKNHILRRIDNQKNFEIGNMTWEPKRGKSK